MAWHMACGVSSEPRTCIMHALMRWQDGESGVNEPRGGRWDRRLIGGRPFVSCFAGRVPVRALSLLSDGGGMDR